MPEFCQVLFLGLGCFSMWHHNSYDNGCKACTLHCWDHSLNWTIGCDVCKHAHLLCLRSLEDLHEVPSEMHDNSRSNTSSFAAMWDLLPKQCDVSATRDPHLEFAKVQRSGPSPTKRIEYLRKQASKNYWTVPSFATSSPWHLSGGVKPCASAL